VFFGRLSLTVERYNGLKDLPSPIKSSQEEQNVKILFFRLLRLALKELNMLLYMMELGLLLLWN